MFIFAPVNIDASSAPGPFSTAISHHICSGERVRPSGFRYEIFGFDSGLGGSNEANEFDYNSTGVAAAQIRKEKKKEKEKNNARELRT